MGNYLHLMIFQNTVLEYLVAGLIFFGTLAFVWLGRALLRRMNAPYGRRRLLRDFLDVVLKHSVFPALQFLSVYFAAEYLSLRPQMDKALRIYATFVLTIASIRFLIGVGRFLMVDVWAQRESDKLTFDRQYKSLMPIVSIVIWSLGIIFLLDNLGMKLSAVITGLGIGGVALALASQAVLGDLFSYFAILFDKPFDIDDFIVVDNFMGKVEYIGIKTTRVRSLGGEQVVLSNTDLTKSRLRNYRHMQTRRVEFKFDVAFETPTPELEQIPELVKTIIMKSEDTQFERAHIADLTHAGIVVDAVYHVLSDDYNKYKDIQQAIILRLKSGLEERGVDFAFPAQTLYMHQSSAVPRRPGPFPIHPAVVTTGDNPSESA